MRDFCPNCGTTRDLRIAERRETYRVRNEPIEVDARVAVCAVCGKDVFDPQLDETTLRAAYAVYRARRGLLQPEEIRALRERYGLSQRALSRLLGWGLITIQRYERGALQDPAHDGILRRLGEPGFVLQALERNRNRLSDREYQRIRAAVLRQAVQHQDDDLIRALEKRLELRHGEADRGFRPFEFERFANTVLWFAERVPDLFKTKLAKVLWLADFAHFHRHRISITGLAYARGPHGPIPDGFKLLLSALEEVGLVDLRATEIASYLGEIVVPRGEADREEFDPAELETLEVVARRYGPSTSKDLSDLSHLEPTWAGRRDGDLIPYPEADSVSIVRDLWDAR